jgi:hypothetical protein
MLSRLCVLQPQARGLDRLFRLYREDQLMSMRMALSDCHSDMPSGPRPIVFRNTVLEDISFHRSHAPVCIMSVDIPMSIATMTPEQLVCPAGATSLSATCSYDACSALTVRMHCSSPSGGAHAGLDWAPCWRYRCGWACR